MIKLIFSYGKTVNLQNLKSNSPSSNFSRDTSNTEVLIDDAINLLRDSSKKMVSSSQKIMNNDNNCHFDGLSKVRTRRSAGL